jgi:hypothetical protein
MATQTAHSMSNSSEFYWYGKLLHSADSIVDIPGTADLLGCFTTFYPVTTG